MDNFILIYASLMTIFLFLAIYELFQLHKKYLNEVNTTLNLLQQLTRNHDGII